MTANRRDLMGMAAFGAVAAAAMGEAEAAPAPFTGLDAPARARGMPGFGSCIGDSSGINRASSFRDHNFHEGDKIVAWGEANRMKVRGHNLLWLRPGRNPGWMNDHDSGPRPAAFRAMAPHA